MVRKWPMMQWGGASLSSSYRKIPTAFRKDRNTVNCVRPKLFFYYRVHFCLALPRIKSRKLKDKWRGTYSKYKRDFYNGYNSSSFKCMLELNSSSWPESLFGCSCEFTFSPVFPYINHYYLNHCFLWRTWYPEGKNVNFFSTFRLSVLILILPLVLLNTQIYVEILFHQFWAPIKIPLIIHRIDSGTRFMHGHCVTCWETCEFSIPWYIQFKVCYFLEDRLQ